MNPELRKLRLYKGYRYLETLPIYQNLRSLSAVSDVYICLVHRSAVLAFLSAFLK